MSLFSIAVALTGLPNSTLVPSHSTPHQKIQSEFKNPKKHNGPHATVIYDEEYALGFCPVPGTKAPKIHGDFLGGRSNQKCLLLS